jgi:hypothetical protein
LLHVAEAAKYGGYFVTRDKRLLSRARTITSFLQVEVVTPSTFLLKVEEARMQSRGGAFERQRTSEGKTAPRFVFLSPEAIRHSFSGASMGYSDETSTVQAAQTRGTIYLPVSFTLGRDDYILVHELVHHLQDESGKVFPCLPAREYEAYAIQTSFVQQTGSGEMPNDMFMLMLRRDIR